MNRWPEIYIHWFRKEDSCQPEDRIRLAVETLTGQAAKAAEWRLERTVRGKPYFPEHREIGLSVSHSGDYWVCALAEQPIGIDLQVHVRRPGESSEAAALRYSSMARRFFHETEAAYVLEQDSYQRFFRVWAAKESYVKYTGSGIDDEFGHVSVVPQETGSLPQASQQGGSDRALWTASGAWFMESGGMYYGVPEEYTLCVCSGQRLLSEQCIFHGF